MVTEHCWTSRAEHLIAEYGEHSDECLRSMAEPPATCMLEGGHAGEHEWTLDSDITLVFAPASVTP